MVGGRGAEKGISTSKLNNGRVGGNLKKGVYMVGGYVHIGTITCVIDESLTGRYTAYLNGKPMNASNSELLFAATSGKRIYADILITGGLTFSATEARLTLSKFEFADSGSIGFILPALPPLGFFLGVGEENFELLITGSI